MDYGFVGDIDRSTPRCSTSCSRRSSCPIVSPLSADDDGTLLNINADTVAAALGGGARRREAHPRDRRAGILESRDDPRSLISYIDLAGLARLKEAGKLSGGMLPKTAAIETALAGGVRRVHVVS